MLLRNKDPSTAASASRGTFRDSDLVVSALSWLASLMRDATGHVVQVASKPIYIIHKVTHPRILTHWHNYFAPRSCAHDMIFMPVNDGSQKGMYLKAVPMNPLWMQSRKGRSSLTSLNVGQIALSRAPQSSRCEP